jgi:hypothetical protein
MPNPDLIPEPFAQSGDKNTIPLERAIADPVYRASWKAGFPPDTRLPKDLGGEAPDGLDFNGVLNILSQAVVFLQKGNAYQFDAALAPYPIGALVRSNDNLTTYQSTVVSNSNNPNSNMTGWRIYNGSGFIVDNLTTNDSAKALSTAQGKVLQDNKLESNKVGASNGVASLDENTKVPVAQLPNASTSASGAVQLNNTLTSASTTQALTAAQGKVLNDQAFGVGQTWQDVSSSRASGVTYINTTNRPIFISIYSNTGQSYGKSVTLLVDDVRVGYMDTASNDDAQLTAIIPPNSKYSVSFSGFVLNSNLWWVELR